MTNVVRATHLLLIDENINAARALFIRTKILDKHFEKECNLLLNLHLKNGHLNTYQLSTEITRRVLIQMLFAGMFN